MLLYYVLVCDFVFQIQMTFHMLSIRDMDVQFLMSMKGIRIWTDVDTDAGYAETGRATLKLSWSMCVTVGGVVHVC